MADTDPTGRFSDRVADYIKYRPSYPKEIFELLDEIGISKNVEIADIGAGTGILSKLLCEAGYEIVYGIEPNTEMFAALGIQMAEFSNFIPLMTAAEKTGLDDDSVDLITCAQSFHWFHTKMARSEFRRIIKPGGWILLIWNTWPRIKGLGKAYEDLLLKHSKDYDQVAHTNLENDDFDYLWGTGKWQLKTFDNAQYLDFEAFRGRMLSSSYSPTPEYEKFDEMMAELKDLFDKFKKNGKIAFEYETEVYFGQIK